MTLFYFNDRKVEQTVYTNGLNTFLGILQPGQGKEFQINVPKGYIPFVKVWESGTVMIDSMASQGERAK